MTTMPVAIREAAAVNEEVAFVRPCIVSIMVCLYALCMKVETEASEGHVCTPARVSAPAPDCPSSEALRL